MSDCESEALQIMRLQVANSVPRPVKIVLATAVSFFVCLSMVGINLAGPIQIMAVAYAESYKANLVAAAASDAEIDELRARITRLESMAHPPAGK